MKRHRDGPPVKKAPEISDLKCPKCDKVFKSKKSIDSHIENVHNKFPCDLCGVLICSKHKKVKLGLFEVQTSADLCPGARLKYSEQANY